MPHIHVEPDRTLVEINAPETILQASLKAGIQHAHACGGNARCSTCRGVIQEGLEHCAPPNQLERKMAKRLSLSPSVRLACQTTVDGDVSLRRFVLDAEDIELTRQLTAGTSALSFGEEKCVAILFADIRGFTTLSEKLPPYDVIYGLNRYFHKMSQVVSRHGGYIDNYMGDGLMALFGVEQAEGAALQAVKAGLEMLEEVERMKHYVETVDDVSFGIRIGVHYGEAVVGAVIGIAGPTHSKRITAIGDAVNYASRIEAANKDQGTSFLISEETYHMVKNEIVTGKKCERVTLRGKSGEHVLYEVIGIKNLDQDPNHLQAGSREAVKMGAFC